MDRHRLGPAPASTQEPLSPSRARVASALGELGPDVTLSTLAARLGGHPNATRQHLDGLAADGHATSTPLAAGGGGGRAGRRGGAAGAGVRPRAGR